MTILIPSEIQTSATDRRDAGRFSRATVTCVVSSAECRSPGRSRLARLRPGRGFTLFEVSLVLALLVIVAAMAIPSYRSTLKFERLRKAADSIRADWRRTRTQAMMTGETQVWACTLAGNGFSASPYSSDYGLGAGSDMQNTVSSLTGLTPTQSSSSGTSFGQTFPEGVTISEVLVSEADSVTTMTQTANAGEGGVATLFFYPDGSSSSGRVTVTNEEGRSMAVAINGLAGTVRIMRIEERSP